ncbi:polyadenylate-binding protein-interacting protein 3 isoform X1 [Dendrobium catenatum]|uniref:polyadenylate-binding protein-interacting protein 3 isoform X1 n=1 Tax=Dendrobium catenatum TaxID=906689 RepID=UPI00109F920F|nr:polyadenylate-binding protein-interacting protein 3 isoform X1 [Dendrobium catenatum]XP_028547723.1 polyadenylate-binding protein-interacting protein 3 isoform X1 [Dendrobium catenatum]XP_028547724.1 polyadenylate-binding protein-interacting protein 3 isoform X1 [Dendrobium catenatum]XP_028547725.1 polyadenylate-binding protein-interacting protein 3 isoform X1 [Dendrobium catenatum]XP_028547726.1 polyadenylate-binding protein-interacting protein 3 isoform X1 [Dendrobium catenatum]XP_0285477
MSLQQGIQSRTSANGFNRRRFDREGGARIENKMHTGKSGSSNFASTLNGGKIVPASSPSSDRLIYVSSCLIGLHVEVHVKNGSTFSGIFYSVNAKDFGIILKMAQLIKDGAVKGQKGAPEAHKRPQTIIIPARELVQIIAKDVPLAIDEFSTANVREKRKDLMIDSVISRSHNVEVERELERWTPDVDDPECPELDNIFDGTWNRNWDQFQTNETLFGVKSTFNEELYTTKLVRGPHMREIEREASRIAREIEGEETHDLHLAEERGMHFPDIDEESRYSAVHRQIDDGRLEENEDLSSNSFNTETFGVPISSEIPRSYSNISWEKKNDEGKSSSPYSSVDEEILSTCASDKDAHSSVTNKHSSSSTPDDAKKCVEADDSNSTSHQYTDKPVQDHNESKSFLIEKSVKVSREANKIKGEDERFFINKKGLPSPAVAYGPPSSDPENKDIISLPSDKIPVCSEPDYQFPVTSTSCISEHIAADSASNGPSLSPSSSLCSLSSERSTLNPNAKEFKLNPNAKSFTPSSFRPSAPMSESSLYYTNAVPTVPPMQGMPMGVGIGPPFGAHQAVYNPQAPQLQSSPYIHANGPMYGAQMIVGQPQPFYYMPTYPPGSFSLQPNSQKSKY